jgi:hypothetical protein
MPSSSEAADDEAAHGPLAKDVGEGLTGVVARLERRVGVLGRAGALGDDGRGAREAEVATELGARRALYAVGRPGLEVRGLGRVPVTRGDDRLAGGHEPVDRGVQNRHDLVTARHGERAAGAEVVLHVDEQQRCIDDVTQARAPG